MITIIFKIYIFLPNYANPKYELLNKSLADPHIIRDLTPTEARNKPLTTPLLSAILQIFSTVPSTLLNAWAVNEMS
jgi:hypothetical protein